MPDFAHEMRVLARVTGPVCGMRKVYAVLFGTPAIIKEPGHNTNLGGF